jgi:hypothetical protein
MAEVVGGLWVRTCEMTRSFGIEPGSAGGTGVLPTGETETGLAVGDYVVYSFGGLNFFGLISSIKATNDRTSGVNYSFSILDNRIRMRWMLCFGQWNMAEERNLIHARQLPRPPDGEFTTGDPIGDDSADFGAGITVPSVFPPPSSVSAADAARGMAYAHRVPSQWYSQIITYTDTPVSAADIIRSAAKHALGGFGFSFDFHSGQSRPVFEVDANSGMTMAALIEQVTSAQGLQVTIDGARTLRWERRGEGTLVIPPPPVHVTDDGLEMSAEATKVRIVGDRVLVQVNDISLEPDWVSGWEAFISEPAWLDEVKTVFELPITTAAERAELAAKSREITLRQYIVTKGGDAYDLIDHGVWDQVSRLNMPVWKYLNDIVFRSYRIPDDLSIFGINMRLLEIHENLLAAVQIADPDKIVYRTDPLEYYPQAAAYVIAKGQPLDMLAFADREALFRLRENNLSNIWSEVPDFTLDAANHSIRFSTAVFQDGDPEAGESILLYPNSGGGGYEDISAEVDADSDWLPIVLPNPDYVIAPAEVKVSLVLRLGKYFKDFGTGQRWKPEILPNVSPHLLLRNAGDSFSGANTAAYSGSLGMPSPPDGSLLEVLYKDGSSADELAQEHADGVIQRSGLERSGKYLRHGSVGTSVSGVIDRVTTQLDWQSGVKEIVDFAKPRPTTGFISSRDFAARVSSEELFGGQRELQREIRQLRGIAKLERAGADKAVRRTSGRVITDLSRRPPGGENLTVKTYDDVNDQFPEDRGPGVKWRAGDLMWLDDKGLPSRTGANFAGVVVADSSSKSVVVATGGTIPTAVAPGTDPASPVTAEAGSWFASNSGTYPIGMLNHGSVAPGSGDAVIGLVRLGGGGGGGVADCHFADEVSNAGVGADEPGVRGGTLIAGDQTWNVLPFPFPLGTDGVFLIWIEVGVTCNSEDDLPLPNLLTSTEPTWESGAIAGGYPATVQPDGTTPTGTAIIAIGTLTVTDGAPSWEPAGCGNITLGYCPTNITISRG